MDYDGRSVVFSLLSTAAGAGKEKQRREKCQDTFRSDSGFFPSFNLSFPPSHSTLDVVCDLISSPKDEASSVGQESGLRKATKENG